MIYFVQAVIAIGFIISERWYTKLVKQNIQDCKPYNSGYFKYHELTGKKAVLMHKGSLIFLRIFIMLTLLSMVILDIMQ